MNKPLARLEPQQLIGFTAAEFLHMGELGAFDDMKVELVRGEIQRMTPPMGGHGSRQASVVGQLWAAIPDPYGKVFGEVAVDLGGDTILGCDAALGREPVLDRRPLRSDELVLVVEIAETTVLRDLDTKRPLYAAAGTLNYWVVDGERRVTHVFADPAGGDYPDPQEVPFGQPLTVPGTSATVTL